MTFDSDEVAVRQPARAQMPGTDGCLPAPYSPDAPGLAPCPGRGPAKGRLQTATAWRRGTESEIAQSGVGHRTSATDARSTAELASTARGGGAQCARSSFPGQGIG